MKALLLMVAAAAQPNAAPQPDLNWLAGYWLSCEEGQDVGETWSELRGGIMLGTNITTGNDAFSWEQMRIEADGQGLAFLAQPRGRPPTAFRLVRWGGSEAVFENPENDFPQRIIYRREGDRLLGRIEGGDGRGIEWRFRAAALNSRCGEPT